MSDVKIKVTSDGRELRSDMKQNVGAIKEVESATKGLTVSAQRMGELLKQAGGDLTKAAQMAAAEQRVVAATTAQTSQKTVEATQKEQEVMQRKRMAMIALHEQALKLNSEMDRQNATVDRASPKYRTAAAAAAQMSFVLSGATGSALGAAAALGTVAASVADLTKNARLAASASVLGALATVAAAGIVIWDSYTQKVNQVRLAVAQAAREINTLSARLSDHNLLAARLEISGNITKEMEEVEKEFKTGFLTRMSAAIWRTVGAGFTPDIEIERQELLNKLIQKREFLLANLAKQTSRNAERETGTILADAAQRQLAITNEVAARKAKIIADTRREIDLLKDAEMTDAQRVDRVRALNRAKQVSLDLIDLEIQKMNTKEIDTVLSGSDNAAVAFQAKMDMLRIERDEYIKVTGDKLVADQLFNQKSAQLRKDLFQAHLGHLKQIQDVTANSNNANTKAIYNFVKNLRAVELGYEAAKATIASFREGAAAIAAAAVGNFGSAALHAAAAVKFAATAAIAAAEAGGGARAGGGGGAAGGGGPQSQQESTRIGATMGGGGQGQTIKLEFVYIEKDASGNVTRRIAHNLERLKDLNMPVRLTV